MSVYVIRHGDREDYANPEAWRVRAEAAGGNLSDPPLSRLGRQQANETAMQISELLRASNTAPEDVVILASPYLRTIQTAQPTADQLGLPIHLEHGLAESHFRASVMAKPRHDHWRWLTFPQVDATYQSLWHRQHTPGYRSAETEKENFPSDYYRRLATFAHLLETALQPGGRYAGKVVLCFSHAASTALVASLVRDVALHNYKFAPCGIFHVAHHAHSSAPQKSRVRSIEHGKHRSGIGSWILRLRGDTNPHCSENSPTTHPWGFSEERSALFLDMWGRELRALRDSVWAKRRATPPVSPLLSQGSPSPRQQHYVPPAGMSVLIGNSLSVRGAGNAPHGATSDILRQAHAPTRQQRIVHVSQPPSPTSHNCQSPKTSADEGPRPCPTAQPYTLAVLEDRLATIEHELHKPGVSNLKAYKLKKDLTRARAALLAERRRLAAHTNVQ
eukprot:INCI10180.3.p1 GENE.INCI10180.3~~INCI10180.3.p1  ORF type:complete len:446 (+),score=27.35 INCI10180.3:223-1560(+)